MDAGRRFLLTGLAAASLTPRPAVAQPPGKIWRLGFLYSGSRQSMIETGRFRALHDGLRDLGYVEGKNLVIEARFFEGDPERLRTFAAELIQLNPDVVVASGASPAKVLQRMSPTIPIVVAVAFDPVREGLAVSLAHPGSNVTGLAALLDEVFPKHVELLKQAVPNLTRLAALSRPTNSSHPGVLKRVHDIAGRLGVQVLPVAVASLKDLEPGFATMGRERVEGLLILGDGFFVQHLPQIATLALKQRLPSTYSGHEYPESGGLMSYGPNFSDNYRRVAHFVDRIVRGAKPGDLPFEQPTRLHLVINLKAATAIGVTIPPSLRLRADRVIE